MARTNTLRPKTIVHTHEGAVATPTHAYNTLRRSVLSCLLWENNFYESGEEIGQRILSLCKDVTPAQLATLAVEARQQQHLRHVGLQLLVGWLRHHPRETAAFAETCAQVIQRPDELGELLALYWREGKKPLAAQLKRGLRRAVQQFSAFQIARYRGEKNKITLRDVIRLVHPKPLNEEQSATWKALCQDTLRAPDTWERELSDGKDAKETWERLLRERKLGGLALLRNLRNMQQKNVAQALIEQAMATHTFARVLPFRFITAAQHNAGVEPLIEAAFLRIMAQQTRLPGRTLFVIDVSGSMAASLSSKSQLDRIDAAAGLAMILRECCEDIAIYATAGNDSSRIHATEQLPARHGFALRDALRIAKGKLGGGGIFLTQCLSYIHEHEPHGAARIIVFTDEQDCERDPAKMPARADAFGGRNYLINVSPHKNGISYTDKWTHIDGFSEAVVKYIAASEGVNVDVQGEEDEQEAPAVYD